MFFRVLAYLNGLQTLVHGDPLLDLYTHFRYIGFRSNMIVSKVGILLIYILFKLERY